MKVDKLYYQIQATIDSKIIGRSELPLSVEISDKRFLTFRKEYLVDVNKYFEKSNVYEDFPKDIKAKMYQRKKNPIDLMLVMPMCLGIPFIVSEKIKKILENLKVNKSEYHLEKLFIEGSYEAFYFLFIPMLKNSDTINYNKSVFYSASQDRFAVFGTFENYLTEKINRFKVKRLFISKKFQNQDIIRLQAAGPFFSERLVDAFEESNVVGYEIIKGGDFEVNLILE
ncbi:hypothetical protein MKJ01_15965 [Chryseobacterium sp. SSA4.19]|uniref:hypothetical protein n=1 Tax=Chryseobacterium sp. SSA4.19 TaxID=2919915 RepID=UPI001F4ED253|nr:hypothetical protein [Chryseobacterium sp. SSA4.19]MCJ8155261.1 hypothetical protein [Chryseobacterium sp. SSA4.19]